MDANVTVQCVACRNRETVPLTAEPPSCSRCFAPVFVVSVEVKGLGDRNAEAIGSRNVDALERDAPHLLAPSEPLEGGGPDAA